jgi:hypothetical protein
VLKRLTTSKSGNTLYLTIVIARPLPGFFLGPAISLDNNQEISRCPIFTVNLCASVGFGRGAAAQNIFHSS